MAEPPQQAQWATAMDSYPVNVSTAPLLQDRFAAVPQYETGFALIWDGQVKNAEPNQFSLELRRNMYQAFNGILAEGLDPDESLAGLDTSSGDMLIEID